MIVGRTESRSAADVFAYSAYALVAVSLTLVSIEPRFGTPWWVPAALGLAGIAVLASRRRSPVAAFGVAVVVTMVSLMVGTGAEVLLAVITLHGVGVRRSPAVAWSCFAAAMAAGALAALVFTTRLATGPSLWGSPPVTPRDPVLDWAVAVTAVAVVLLVTALLGTGAGQRRRYVSALLDRADQLARERDHQAEIASARERERIAREMHDVIAHSLSVMIALADGAHAAADERPEAAKTAAGRAAETGRRTLGEVRRLLGPVRGGAAGADPVHAPQPDASQLAALVAEFGQAGLPTRLAVRGTPAADPTVGLTVYRIVQESLTNVLRHSRDVEDVAVTVAWSEEDVHVVVRDSSSRVAPLRSAGRGILGMRERAALFGGTIEAGPHDDGGWQVSARLCWEGDER